MTFIIVLALILCVGVITFLIFTSFEKLNRQKKANQILRFGRNRDYYIYDMLKSALPQNTVMRKRFFPVTTPKGVFDTEVDIVCILSSGIAIIDIRGAKGNISELPSGEWRAEYKGSVRRFSNPYDYNQINVASVKIALEKAGILNVPIYNYVVFPDEEVSFTRKYPWLLQPENVVERIKNLDNKMILTRRDKQNITAFFSRYAKAKHPPIRPKKPKTQQNKKRVKRNENQIKKVRR